MAKPEKTQEAAQKMKTIKCHVLNADGDLVPTLIQVPDVAEDKRPAYDPRIDRMASKLDMSAGTLPSSKHDIVTTSGVE